MLGNDVVDLASAPAPRARFVDRVLCGGERTLLAASAEPAVLLWSLFAAKEAAYKALSRARSSLVFAHRAFVVAPDLGSIRYEDTALALRIERTTDWVHALAHGTGEAPTWAVSARGDADPSVAARRLLREHAAARLGVAADSLDVACDARPSTWTGSGPPRLVSAGETWEAVSLSHDERFVACAIDLPLRGTQGFLAHPSPRML